MIAVSQSKLVKALILSAGRSSRMGAFKPLLPLRGRTVLECSVESVLQGGAEEAVVVTGNRAEELESLLARRFPHRVRWVRNENWAATDMLSSVQLGAAALGSCGAFFLLPGDMPFVAPDTFAALLEERQRQPSPVLFPTHKGRRGHPPLIDAALLPAILSYDGPEGLRGLWSRYDAQVRTVPVQDSGIAKDLDTPEDYQRFSNPELHHSDPWGLHREGG